MATVASPGTGTLEAAEPEEPTTAPPAARVKDATDRLASRVLLYSFVAAVLLAIGAFVVVAVYLFQYLHHAVDAFSTRSLAPRPRRPP